MKIEEVWPEWSVVGEPIGYGSYGVVYKCICSEGEEDEKYSAIKVISVPRDDISYSSLSAEKQENIKAEYKEIIDSFVNEIKILETLKGNKNIVAIEDSEVVEREDGIGWQIFIRMELLTDLEEYMEHNVFEKKDVLKLGIDLCRALKACSEKKIIHRDIKPSNIFVDSEGNFKLGDFGVAKQLEKTEAAMSIKGTYNYMAPEVISSKRYDSRADIYSLSLVMYWILNNRRLPFIDTEMKYSNQEEAFGKRISGERILPIKNIENSINNMLLRALEFKPDNRFKNADEFEKAIIDLSEGKKIKKSLKQIVNSKKGKALLSVLLIISIIAGTSVYIFTNRDSTVIRKLIPTLKSKIEYSGICEGIYTQDEIDYCAGYNQTFCVATDSEVSIISNQNCDVYFTIVNDIIYYNVIEKNNIVSCWSMDLNGTNKKKVFSYSHNPNQFYGFVIFADNERVYYFEKVDEETKISSYCFSTKSVEDIYSSVDEPWISSVCYVGGFIVFSQGDGSGVDSYPAFKYNIKTKETTKLLINAKRLSRFNDKYILVEYESGNSLQTKEATYQLYLYNAISDKYVYESVSGIYNVCNVYEEKALLRWSSEDELVYSIYDLQNGLQDTLIEGSPFMSTESGFVFLDSEIIEDEEGRIETKCFIKAVDNDKVKTIKEYIGFGCLDPVSVGSRFALFEDDESYTFIDYSTETGAENSSVSTTKTNNTYETLSKEFQAVLDEKDFPKESYEYFYQGFNDYYNNYDDWYNTTPGLPDKATYIRKYLIESLKRIKRVNFYPLSGKQAQNFLESGNYSETSVGYEITVAYDDTRDFFNFDVENLVGEWVGMINHTNVIYDEKFEQNTDGLYPMLKYGCQVFHMNLCSKKSNCFSSGSEIDKKSKYVFEYCNEYGGYFDWYNYYSNLVCFAGFDTMEDVVTGKADVSAIKGALSDKYGESLSEKIMKCLKEQCSAARDESLLENRIEIQKLFLECIKKDIGLLEENNALLSYVDFYRSYKVFYSIHVVERIELDYGCNEYERTADYFDLWSIDEMLAKKIISLNAITVCDNPEDNKIALRCLLFNTQYDGIIPFISWPVLIDDVEYYYENKSVIMNLEDDYYTNLKAILTYAYGKVTVNFEYD